MVMTGGCCWPAARRGNFRAAGAIAPECSSGADGPLHPALGAAPPPPPVTAPSPPRRRRRSPLRSAPAAGRGRKADRWRRRPSCTSAVVPVAKDLTLAALLDRLEACTIPAAKDLLEAKVTQMMEEDAAASAAAPPTVTAAATDDARPGASIGLPTSPMTEGNGP